MSAPQYADISAYQRTIDWAVYHTWAKQWTGTSIVAIKATEGVGFTDPSYTAHRQGALAAGVDMLIYYGFARPDLGHNPVDEANWLHSVVGAIRPQDLIMLDIEVNTTADWAYRWLVQQETNYGKPPVIYTYDNFARTHLQDGRLARFPLVLAIYTYNPNARPPCPTPWQSYLATQYTDKATIPGIPGVVDANVYIGGQQHMPIPTNWKDDGHTLTSPSGHHVVLGFRDHIINSATWDTGNEPLEEEYHAGQVLLHNAPLGAGQRQAFRDTLLWFTQEKGVVQEPYLGLEIKACYDEIAALQAEVAKLTATAPVVYPKGVNIMDAIAQLRIIQASAGSAAAALTTAFKDLGVQ